MSAVLQRSSTDAPATVRATLNYTRRNGERPRTYTFEPPPGVPRYGGEVDAREVTLHNGRLERDLALDRSGAELIRHRSALREWADYQDDARVQALYYPEVQAALSAHLGADQVLVFDHTLRDSTATGYASVREPVRRVHDDQTFHSAPNRVRKHLSPEEAELRLQRRFAIINFWRPIGAPVQQSPLAVCDARTIAADDLIPSDLIYPDWTGETYSVAYNPAHRWYWFPRQTPEEVALLKIYDSATDGTARLTAHTAFDLPAEPGAGDDAPPRRSIEVRTLVFW